VLALSNVQLDDCKKCFASGGKDKKVTIFDAETGNEYLKFKFKRQMYWISTLAWHSKSGLLFVGSVDGEISFYTETGNR